MTRMTGPDCAVMCNFIYIHTYIHAYIHTYKIHTYTTCTQNHEKKITRIEVSRNRRNPSYTKQTLLSGFMFRIPVRDIL